MSKVIKVDALSRVEGEGSLRLTISGDQVRQVTFGVYEPPRLFEGFLEGRHYSEAPDFVARICGICPIAHQTSCSQAMEDALGIRVPDEVRALRRLIYCGEWIESHALHIFFLHAPDFLGYTDALSMVDEHKALVQTALRIKKVGNSLMRIIGGREVHPVSPRVGGFYAAPKAEALAALRSELTWAEKASREALDWLARLPMPEYQHEYLFVSLAREGEYPVDRGEVVTSLGERLAPGRFLDTFEEYQVAHSTALHARHRAKGDYLVGPLARFNLNFGELPEDLRAASEAMGLTPPVTNPFRSILVRAVELVYACREAARLIRAYREPASPAAEAPARAGRGSGVSEAPRGLLYHGYTLDADGLIQKATVIPPTSQNQATIESDLKGVARRNLDLDGAALKKLCEQAIRNYDPCISCSTH